MPKFDKWLTGLPADATVADAARVAIATRTNEAADRLALAAADVDADPEHVHQLRVAARRTAAVLEIFKKLLPEKQADRLAWSTRLARRAAGPARDLDVFLARLQKLSCLPGLQGRLYAQRESAQADLTWACRKLKNGKKIRRQAAKLVKRLPADYKRAHKLGNQPFEEWAAGRLRREAGKFLRAAPDASAEVAELHQFRISAKRLRYALEVLSAGLPPKASNAAYKQLTAVQNRLGAINDHAALIQRLEDAAAWTLADEQADLAEVVRGEQQRQREATEAFAGWWDRSRAESLADLLGATKK